jgi:hypothetical protein
LHRARPAGRFVGETTGKLLRPSGLPTARIARAPETTGGGRETAAHLSGLRMGALRLACGKGKAMGGVRAWLARLCIGRHPDPGEGSQPCFRVLDGFWVTTLRTSSALVIASPLGPVHLAAVATHCRENVEAANVLAQLLRHPRITVCGLPHYPVGSKSCGSLRRTLLAHGQKRVRLSVAGASMEVCSAQRAEMDSAWGSCLTTVPRR